MNLIVGVPHFHGRIRIPPSKSHTLRALICAALADSSSYIESPLDSDDISTAAEILQSLGVRIRKRSSNPAAWEITPPTGGLIAHLNSAGTHAAESPMNGMHSLAAGSMDFMRSSLIFSQPDEAAENTDTVHRRTAIPEPAAHHFHQPPLPLYFGNSGSLLYFLGAVLAVSSYPMCFTGDASLQSRPAEPLLSIYRQAAIPYTAASNKKKQAVLPLTVCGPLTAQSFTLSGPFSQPVSGLLFAAPLLHGTTRIFFKNPGEVPYLHITCNWLQKAGIDVQAAADGSSFTITGIQPYRAFSHKIPGDWSSAAFPLAAAAVSRQALTLENLDIHDGQGDSRIVALLQQMGAAIAYREAEKSLTVLPAETLTGISCDCSDIPDTVPVLAALACFAQGTTHLTNAGVCRYKECDRLHAIAEELSQFGADITEGSDFLVIHGKGGHNLHPARVHSRGDHRIAMALAVTACGIAALSADPRFSRAETASTASNIPCSCIEHFDCTAISYPSFMSDLTAAGASFSLTR